MIERNCCIRDHGESFRYRAGAIIVEDGYVLFAGNETANYLYSIGGAVHLHESAEAAVLREVYEETGIHYEIDRLAVIHETFYIEGSGTLCGTQCHEIALYFLMKSRGTRELKSDSYTMGVRETMHWVKIDELPSRKAFPAFMPDYLKNPSENILHIVTDERPKKENLHV